jgi:hypothetical protein
MDGFGPADFQAQIAQGAFILVCLDSLGVLSVLTKNAHRTHPEAFATFLQTQAILPVYLQIYKKTHIKRPLQFEVLKIPERFTFILTSGRGQA